jgi:phosphoribosylaminoimidazole-succinocarboxamide synthase
MKLVVLVSGNGTNLQALIDNGYNISLVISNNAGVTALSRAKKNNIPTTTLQYDPSVDTRETYDAKLINIINTRVGRKNTSFLIVCAGFMRILSKFFTDYYPKRIINLHPALPGAFPGVNAIEKAWSQRETLDKTGVMCHFVDHTLDAGELITVIEVPVKKTDTLKYLKTRVQYFEKKALMTAIDKVSNEISFYRKGKVRDLYNVGSDKLLLAHSDRVSSFDRNIGTIPGKGHILADMTTWWFNRTRDIVPNHLIGQHQQYILARRCTQIPIEFVVRGYITGSTKTSIWTHYKNGSRNYCGNELPEGLDKNQRLETPLLTPTTKGGIGIFSDTTDDVPITPDEIVERGVITRDQLNYLRETCFKLFELGQQVSSKRGLILVDTKYEFGFDEDGNITLIDEVHTCDSSRYWKLDTYESAMESGSEPDKVDKDTLRDYIKSVVADPYTSELPEIPSDVVDKMFNTYNWCYTNFSGDKTTRACRVSHTDLTAETESDRETLSEVVKVINQARPLNVFVMCGSPTDAAWRDRIVREIREYCPEANFHLIAKSAHKFTREVVEILDGHARDYPASKSRNVYVTIAGMSNALSGVVACNVTAPVFAIPPFKDQTDMMVNINSTLQMPSKVPVMTVLRPDNLAMSIQRLTRF